MQWPKINGYPISFSILQRWVFCCSWTTFLLAICASCGTEKSPQSGNVVLNEISCHGRDWIEIVNVTQAQLDISLWNVADNLSKEGHQYPLPSGTIIQPDEHLVIKQKKDFEAGFEFGLKCAGGETAYLLDADKAIVDEVEIGDAPYGSTWGHLPDLTGLWRVTAPTEGEANKASETASE
jgi:hypothetical protein